MKHVEVDADVRLAALGHQGQGGIETGAERILAAELQGEMDVEPRGPLRRLRQGDDGALQARGVHGLGEVGRHDERRNGELLAQVQPFAKVIEVSAALFALGQQQSALIRRRRWRYPSIREQLAGIRERVRFEVILELGKPNLHAAAAGVGVGGNIVGEAAGQRGRLADAGFHAGSFSAHDPADCGRSTTSISICQNSRNGSMHSADTDRRAYARPT